MVFSSPLSSLSGSEDDRLVSPAPRQYRTRSLARNAQAYAEADDDGPTPTQEARELAHEEEVYHQGVHITRDNQRLHRAQRKADDEDADWIPSQPSGLGRTGSMGSDISMDAYDDSSEEDVPLSLTVSRRATSPPASMLEDDASEYDDEDYNDNEDEDRASDKDRANDKDRTDGRTNDEDRDQGKDQDENEETDTDAPLPMRDIHSRFPEDKLTRKKLYKICKAFLERLPYKNPYDLLYELEGKYKLREIDLRKARQFAEDHKAVIEEWSKGKLLDVARQEWRNLLDNRY